MSLLFTSKIIIIIKGLIKKALVTDMQKTLEWDTLEIR